MSEASANPGAAGPGHPPSDEQLMRAVSQGAPEALAELSDRYQQPVFGFFRRRVADSSDAEKLTRETFLLMVRGAARYQPRALFRTYLYAIGFRILRAHRRKAAIRAVFFRTAAKSCEPGIADARGAAVLLRQAIRRLGPTEREILMLREFEQLSYGEIAELLRLPVSTVRSQLFRARRALRELAESEERA